MTTIVPKKKMVLLIPAFNEEEILEHSVSILNEIINDLIKKNKISDQSSMLIVNDGSKDRTWEIIKKIHDNNPKIWGIKFSRNYGHQNALIAGFETIYRQNKADFVISIDADLQDDPQAIYEMVDNYLNGDEIVFGVRNNRDSDSWFKRSTAESFYKILNKIGVNLVPDHADFRLMGRQAIKAFLEYREENMFIRGIVPLLGFKSSKVFYARKPRLAGESKYPLSKMLSFAWDGITSFSIAPLRVMFSIGILFALIGLIMFFYTIIAKLFGSTEPGWSSLIISIWFVGGFQMISLGLTGEYIGKIFSEVKHRPRYIIEQILE